MAKGLRTFLCEYEKAFPQGVGKAQDQELPLDHFRNWCNPHSLS